MTPELRQAAERLRRLYAGDSPYAPEEDADWIEETGCTRCEHDEAACARAFVAEHPADEDESSTTHADVLRVVREAGI